MGDGVSCWCGVGGEAGVEVPVTRVEVEGAEVVRCEMIQVRKLEDRYD